MPHSSGSLFGATVCASARAPGAVHARRVVCHSSSCGASRAAPSRRGNKYFLLLDEMSKNGEAMIVHGWQAAETYFAPGRSWEDGKMSNGHLVRGYKSLDEAYEEFIRVYTPAKKYVVSVKR